jgi:hypothetical protein
MHATFAPGSKCPYTSAVTLITAVAHLVPHVGQRRAGFNWQIPERMPQIMKPDTPESGLFQHWEEVAVVQVVGIERGRGRCVFS